MSAACHVATALPGGHIPVVWKKYSSSSNDGPHDRDLLRSVADNLDAGDPVTLAAGDKSFTVNVPARPEFEVKVERETGSGSPELSVEFKLEWDEDGSTDAELSVE